MQKRKIMKQTAVEWLVEKLITEFRFSFSDNILEQAKEMEKQQIIDAYESGIEEGKMRELSEEYTLDRSANAEQYYNETFK